MTAGRPAGARPVDPDHFRLERYREDARRMSAPLRAYYTLKPALPRTLQLALRRAYARRQARRPFPAWPIEPILVDEQDRELRRRLRETGDGRLTVVDPWPHGHRFAAILTHDVEGPEGVANIPEVREVERRHGFVSSWNFVAEWYPISAWLFDDLRDAGCEIGLHGIHHDGSLFRSRPSFEAALPKIHRYLAEWDAVGFRSPATLRNPQWMAELGCLYDSSFPDTDPFEPQAGGCCSIHPFFIGDLVELPITLVQDHTLFEILRRRSIDLWVDKSDWIIRHGGLINVIVHPDYLLTRERLALYEAFLVHLRGRIEQDRGWHALPRDIAAWWVTRARLLEQWDEQHPDASRSGWPAGATLREITEREGRLETQSVRTPA